MEDEEGTRFLPPEPPGPEPDLGARPAKEPPAPPPPPPPPQQPPPQQAYGYPPPPGQYGQTPPAYGQPPPPGYAYQPPPPGYGYQAPWGYQQPIPDNGPAVAGFVFSVVALGLLIISAGLSTIISIGCAITGIVLSRKGKRKVESGETPKHRGLAQAGFIIGWVGLGLSILATIGWVLAFSIGPSYDEFRLDPQETRSAAARAVGG